MPRRRKVVRLPDYDYSQPGRYFITICTHDRRCLFGYVADEQTNLSSAGEIARSCWAAIPDHFPHVVLDAYVVMPNHVHGLVAITSKPDPRRSRGTARRAPTTGAGQRRFGQPKPGSLPTIVRSFKSAVTRRINRLGGTPGGTVWQRGYYDHVVRDGRDLDRIRRYIHDNPARWHWDRFHRD